MILAGDVAIARGDRFLFSGFEALTGKPWCFNLEGAIASSSSFLPSWGVYNDEYFIESLSCFNLAPFFLANNHIHDIEGGVEESIAWLKTRGMLSFGAGGNVNEAETSVACQGVSHKYLLLGFGWPVIGCQPAGKATPGVNVLEGRAVLRQLGKAIKEYPGHKIVIVIHGNYEFELYPQPGHRRLAKQLIDAGAYAVICHHPHIVSPVERYLGRTIAYSLGNWAFSFGKFFDGRLKFPPSSFPQIAVELSDDGDKVHHALFEPPCMVHYQRSELISDVNFSLKPFFEGYDDNQYLEWFKSHRIKKRGLPIYTSSNASIVNSVRDYWVALRQRLIDTAAKAGLKKMRRM